MFSALSSSDFRAYAWPEDEFVRFNAYMASTAPLYEPPPINKEARRAHFVTQIPDWLANRKQRSYAYMSPELGAQMPGPAKPSYCINGLIAVPEWKSPRLVRMAWPRILTAAPSSRLSNSIRKSIGPIPHRLGPGRACCSVACVSPLVSQTRKPQPRNDRTSLPDTAIARLKARGQFLAYEETGDAPSAPRTAPLR